MRSIHLRLDIGTDSVAAAFELISDFTRFPAIAQDVHLVETAPGPGPGAPRHSDWEVNFRRGIMRWTERETLDPARLRIEFEQTDGDFEDFHGSWQLTPRDGGAEVLFEVTYDFGIESLAGIMDPIAERVIKRVICAVLEHLFADVVIREGGEALTDLAVQPAARPRPQSVGGS